MSAIYNKTKAEPLTPRKSHKKKLSPYMYLIHDNMKKEELVSKYQSFISEKHNQVLGLRGRAKSNYVKKGATKLPFEPHYNHEIQRSGEKDYLLMHKNRSVGNNQFNLTNNDDLEQSSIMKQYNTQQDVTPDRGNSLMTDNFVSTTKKAHHSQSGSPGRTTQKGSTKKKTMGTSIRARYEKLRDILEERNEELEKERLTFLGCIQRIKDLRVMYFGESEAYFVDPNENATHSFDKEYCALELCIQQDLQKQQHVNKSLQDLENKLLNSEKQKTQAAQAEVQKEREGFQVKMLEKEKVIQELHKALKSSDNDVQFLSKEMQSQQQKLKEAQQQLTQQHELNRKMAKRVNELKKIEEYGTTNVLVQQEIDNLKSSKSDIERKYYELKHKVGDISKLKEDNINLKLELDHRVKDLKVENEKINREYQILMKEYKVIKSKSKQLEDDALRTGVNTRELQDTQSRLTIQIQKDVEIEKQYYETKINSLRKENEQLCNDIENVKRQQRELASSSYSKEDFEKMTAENTKRIKSLEDKINDLSNKNKQLMVDSLSLEKLKIDIDDLKMLYEQEKIQNKELKQKIQISEQAYNEYQQNQKIIHENLRVQLNQTQHQIESIKHQQSIQKQTTQSNDDEERVSPTINQNQVMITQQNQHKTSSSSKNEERVSSQANQNQVMITQQNQLKNNSQLSRNEEDKLSNQSNNNKKNNNNTLMLPSNQRSQVLDDAQSSKSSKYSNPPQIMITQKQKINEDNMSQQHSHGRRSASKASSHFENSEETNVVIPPQQNVKIRSISQQSHQSRDKYSQTSKDIVVPQRQLKQLNESMTNLSQKSKQPVQFTEEQYVPSHKQSVQSNNSSILKSRPNSNNDNKQNINNNDSAINNNNNNQRYSNKSSSQLNPQEQVIIKTYVNTDQTHERRKQRARSQASNYNEQRIEEFDGISEASLQQSKLEKEDSEMKKRLLTQPKFSDSKEQNRSNNSNINNNNNSRNNRRSFHTQPDQEVNKEF